MNYKQLHEKYNIEPVRIKHNNRINKGGDIMRWGYDILYDKYFTPYRYKDIVLAEIGILCGDSLYIHSKYFTNVKIYGYDIDIKPFKETQKEPDFLNKVVDIREINSTKKDETDKINDKFDIIIDDGCHRGRAIIETFKNFYPKLNDKGLYCIEDITDKRINEVESFLKNLNIEYKYEKNLESDKTHGMIFIHKKK